MTIYALSSGPGISGVAIIRVSGQETSESHKIINQKKCSQTKSCNIKKDQ